jgi:NADH-quinone oxidoreductase subunit J
MSQPDPVLVFLASMTIVSAVLAIESKQVVYGAVSLILSFLGMSLIFLYLGGIYLGVVQIGVYIGATAVLILFAVILVGEVKTPESNLNRILGVVAASIVLISLLVGFSALPNLGLSYKLVNSSIEELARELVTSYWLALITIGVMLATVALGAVIITRRGDQT